VQNVRDGRVDASPIWGVCVETSVPYHWVGALRYGTEGS
jgi:hypothetical protein